MNHLAKNVLEIYFELSFVDEDYADFDWSLRLCSTIRSEIEDHYTDAEKSALMSAANDKLSELLSEPDEHGYTPRALVTEDQRQFLQAISEGRFDGSPPG